MSQQDKPSSHLVDLRAEEGLALELDVGDVAGLGTLDVHLPTEFYPRDSQNASAVGRGKGRDVLLVQVQQGDHALPDVVNCHLKIAHL